MANEVATVDELTQFTKGLGNVGTGITPPREITKVDEVPADKIASDKIEADKLAEQQRLEAEKPKEGEQQQEEKEIEDAVIESDETIFDAVKKKLPFELKDEQGNDLTFKDDFDGIVEFTETVGKLHAQKAIDSFLNSNPDIKALSQHLTNGGTVDTFVKQAVPDYSKIVLDKDNVEQLKNIYSTSLKYKGYSDSDIQDLVGIAETNGKLVDKAKIGQTDLIKYREDFFANQEAQKVQFEKQQEQDRLETLNEVKTTLSKGKLLGAELTKQEQDSFLIYLTKSVKDGMTQHQLDQENDSMEHELFHALQRFKKYTNVIPKVADKLKQMQNSGLPTRKNPAIIKSNDGGESGSNVAVKVTASDRDMILGGGNRRN